MKSIAVCLALCVAGLVSCGYGSVALTQIDDSSGSDSPPPALRLLSQDPGSGSIAEPSQGLDPSGSARTISFVFDDSIDPATIGPQTIRIEEDNSGTNDYADIVASVVVDGPFVTLLSSQPLRFESTYTVELTSAIRSLDGIKLLPPAPSTFVVRPPQLGGVELVSFSSRVESLASTAGGATLTLFETQVMQMPTLSVAEARPGEGFSAPELLFTTGERLYQADLHISSFGPEVCSASFLVGRARCAAVNENMPNVQLRLSQRARGALWETGNSVPVLDEAISGNHISFPPSITELDDGTTVAVWWAWTDFRLDPTNPGTDSFFGRWSVFAAWRVPGSDWTPAQEVSQSDLDFVGWPLVDRTPNGQVVALWGLADCAPDQPCDALFGNPDPEQYVGYGLALFDGLGWSSPETLSPAGTGDLLPRATSLRVVDDERAVLVGRSLNQGPVAASVQLPTSTSSPILGQRIALDPSGATSPAPDDVGNTSCDRFEEILPDVRGQFPRLLARGSEFFVSWFSQEGPDVFRVSRLEVDPALSWGETVSFEGEVEPILVGSGATRVDSAGNIIVAFQVGISVLFVNTARMVALRSTDGGETFVPLDGGLGPFISDAPFCVEGLVVGNVDPSGRLALGWSEQVLCGSSARVTGVMRRLQ